MNPCEELAISGDFQITDFIRNLSFLKYHLSLFNSLNSSTAPFFGLGCFTAQYKSSSCSSTISSHCRYCYRHHPYSHRHHLHHHIVINHCHHRLTHHHHYHCYWSYFPLATSHCAAGHSSIILTRSTTVFQKVLLLVPFLFILYIWPLGKHYSSSSADHHLYADTPLHIFHLHSFSNALNYLRKTTSRYQAIISI